MPLKVRRTLLEGIAGIFEGPHRPAQFGVPLLPAPGRLGGLGCLGDLDTRRLSRRGVLGSDAGRCHQGQEGRTGGSVR